MPLIKNCDQFDVQVTCQQGHTITRVHLTFYGRLENGQSGVRVTEPMGPLKDEISVDDIQTIVRAFLGENVYVWKKPVGTGVYGLRGQCDRSYVIKDTPEDQE